ncbi:MAG: hypothetical protein COX52_09025 [Syntrophobacterales bacterium CG23_combo_of_CG06-09_8_20_14_all_48_27]|nr:MAG: hypothetical protein COX52_09025 [Syntrophobacterales bacterium CG23_combo_of_CG06-09_8_20_14_all_48_27]
MKASKLKEFEPIFYPCSIAVAGASADTGKMGTKWVNGLLAAGFKGEIYPVNPMGGEISGLKIYPNLKAIPKPVDLVIVCIPRQFVLNLLDDCAASGVKAVHFFTAGFRETGDPEWIRVEEEMAAKARQGNFRIIGPNCIGIYCPEQRMPYGPSSLLGAAGTVGFISQSGGHAGKLLEIGLGRGIHFSKVISMGNGSDLDSLDFLEYLAVDPKTAIIGAYLEGARDARHLFQAIKNVSPAKPIVVWKGGRTEPGAEAAASHTGALTASASLWSAALKQAGAIEVQGLEELADTMLLLQQLGRIRGNNVGIVCGLTDGGGGESVLAGDACAAFGLNVPPFSEKTKAHLTALLGQVGSILRNPLDISQGYGNTRIVEQAMELVSREPHLDLIIVYENVDILLRFLSAEITEIMNNIFIGFHRRQSKPIVVVLPRGSKEEERLEIEDKFSREGIPVYPTIERAARAIAHVTRYYSRLHKGSTEKSRQ